MRYKPLLINFPARLDFRGGGSTWKPLVQNVGATPSPLSHVSGPPPFVTKTSLAANKYPSKPIGSGHNVAPKPFNGLPHSQVSKITLNSIKLSASSFLLFTHLQSVS